MKYEDSKLDREFDKKLGYKEGSKKDEAVDKLVRNSPNVKKEMAKIYRETRTGLLESTEATKLTWMLQAIQKVIESTDMESRLKVLEDEHVD